MSTHSNSPAPGSTPNANGQPRVIRQRPPANPLVQPKRRVRRPNPSASAPSTSKSTDGNPNQHISNNGPTGKGAKTGKPTTVPETKPKDYGGWSRPPKENYKDYPLMTTKKELLEGIRHHVMRLIAKVPVDPRNEEEFTRPVRLHRRDPRAPPVGARDEDIQMTEENEMDEKERQRMQLFREERDAQRAIKQAQIAPSVNPAANQPRKPPKKKMPQIYRNDTTAEGQARSKLRYEESLPWHLEDFDNKNIWVGNYESALSQTNVILAMRESGEFGLIPMEKWYKFTPKGLFKTLTIEEAEKAMSKKVKEPRWFMETQKETERQQEEDRNRKAGRKLMLRKGDTRDAVTNQRLKTDLADADDLDFDEDRFADDEENPVFEGDEEENKMAEQRIKRDQLQANIFDLKDAHEYDKDEAEEKKVKEMAKQLGKGVVKALKKYEGKYEYESDDENPYTSGVSSYLFGPI
jgi:transcription initiation factor TFIIF subunit alpha